MLSVEIRSVLSTFSRRQSTLSMCEKFIKQARFYCPKLGILIGEYQSGKKRNYMMKAIDWKYSMNKSFKYSSLVFASQSLNHRIRIQKTQHMEVFVK